MVLMMVNQPTMSILFLVALAIVTCQCEDMIQHRPIQFESRDSDNGLAWPLPDAEDPGMLVIHGIHCFDVIQEPVNVSDNMSVMHQQHCRSVIERVVRIFKKNPTYHVNEWICSALGDTRKAQEIFSHSCYGPHGGLCIQWFLSDTSMAEIYRRYGSKMRSVNNPIVVGQGQDEIYIKLAAYNFGSLLMKNFTMPQSLNVNETTYLQQWGNGRATSMAALGVYCQVKGNIGEIENTLNHVL